MMDEFFPKKGSHRERRWKAATVIPYIWNIYQPRCFGLKRTSDPWPGATGVKIVFYFVNIFNQLWLKDCLQQMLYLCSPPLTAGSDPVISLILYQPYYTDCNSRYYLVVVSLWMSLYLAASRCIPHYSLHNWVLTEYHWWRSYL